MSSNLSTVEILNKLISFPTVSSNSNLEIVFFIRDYLLSYGINSEILYNEHRNKASLFASLGPLDKSGYILSAHTDVVPTENQQWSSNPFSMIQKENRLYGRGTADMKGFIACVLSAIPFFISKKLHFPLYLSFSYDEEIGCVGIRPMLKTVINKIKKPILCIIGEPTEMNPVLGHKGKIAVHCDVNGLECHSAYPTSGVNAIEYASRLIVFIENLSINIKNKTYLYNYSFEPPFTTIQTGIIHGGFALNIVPGKCEFDFEIRYLPTFNYNTFLDKINTYAKIDLLYDMKKSNPAAEISISIVNMYPGLSTSIDSEAARISAWLTQSDSFRTVPFGTEGGLFSEAGIPTIICGPGSMSQGHKPDEYITFEQLYECNKFLKRLQLLIQNQPLNSIADFLEEAKN